MKWIKLLKAYDGKAVGDVFELVETDADKLVTAGIAEATDNPSPGSMADAVAELAGAFTKGLTDIAVATKAVVADITESGKKTIAGVARNDDEPLHDWPNFGEFARDVKAMDATKGGGGTITKSMEKYLNALTERKAVSGMSEGVGADGGLLIPPDISTAIYEKAFAEDEVLSRTDQYVSGSNVMEFRTLKQDSRATGSRHGGVRGYWMDEADQFTKSKPVFEPFTLKAKKLGVFIYVTEELLEDAAIGLESYLSNLVAKELRFMMNDAFINGTGVGMPIGFQNHASVPFVTRDTANRILSADVYAIYDRVASAVRQQAVWMIGQSSEAELWKLFGVADAAGTTVGGWPIYLPPGALGAANAAPNGTLLGRPVIVSEFIPAFKAKGDISLVAWNQYATLTKGAVKSAVSMHLRFDFDEIAFRFTTRVDGQPWWKLAVTPFKGSDTLSWAVSLAA